MQALFVPGARLFDILRHSLNRLDGDALHRAGPFALYTADAVVHIHK
jgi:hypothetical protein